MNDIEKLEEIKEWLSSPERLLIVAHRENTTWLISEVERLRGELAEVQPQAEKWQHYETNLKTRVELTKVLAERDATICGMREMSESTPPTWYEEDEMKAWLYREGYPDYAPKFLTENFQKAFEKGWSMLGGRLLFPVPACPHKEEVEKWKGMSERCGDDAVKRELEFVTVKAQLAQAREVLEEVAENMNVACSPELRMMAVKALAQKEGE